MRCDHLRCEHTLYFVACSNTGHRGQRVIDFSCLGRAPWAPVAGRVDDATEHQIGEARVDRTERGSPPVLDRANSLLYLRNLRREMESPCAAHVPKCLALRIYFPFIIGLLKTAGGAP